MIRLDQPWRPDGGLPLQRDAPPGPHVSAPDYRGSGKLHGFGTLVTAGDTSLGRAVALLFAREGADVALAFQASPEDADETRRAVEAEGTRCLLLRGDVADEQWCRRAVQRTVAAFGRLDVLVNNPPAREAAPAAAAPSSPASAAALSSPLAAAQAPPSAPPMSGDRARGLRHVPHSHISDLDRDGDGWQELEDARWQPSAELPLGAYLRMVRSALRYMRQGACIINTGLATGPDNGPAHLLDQAATEGAVRALTRTLAGHLLPRGIRVNAIVPGPVWFPPAEAREPAAGAGASGPSGASAAAPAGRRRAAQPDELSPAYVFLAAPACAASITGLVLPVAAIV